MNKSLFFGLIKNSFKKNLRSKVLIFLLIFSCLAALGLRSLFDFLGEMQLGLQLQGPQALFAPFQLFCLYSMVFGTFIATYLGVDALQSDARSGVTQQILVFPLHPLAYVTHRIGTTFLIVMLSYLFSLIIGLLIFYPTSSSSLLTLNLFLSFIIHSLAFFSITCLSALFSTFLSKIQSFVVVSVLLIFIYFSNSQITTLSNTDFSQVSFFKVISLVLFFFFPRIGHLSSIASNLSTNALSTISLSTTLIHTFAISLIFIYLNYRICKYRDYVI